MKLDPSLFDARTMKNDTRLEFQLKLLLGTICAYGGEIPLSVREIAKRMGTSTYRIKLLLKRLEFQGIVRHENGKLFFNKFKHIRQKEKYAQSDAYAKNFKFLTCKEFLSEDRNVQRFVLHCVGYKLVYMNGRFWWGWYQDLYGENGILNIRSKKEAVRIVQKASKYLYIHMHENNFRVTGVKPEWLDMGYWESEGTLLWIQKKLREHRFCMDYIPTEAMIQIAKVMEHYYAEYGYEYATKVFDFALRKIQQDQARSHRFLHLIYREDGQYITNETVNELDEISAYFRSIMEEAEIEYGQDLSLSYSAIENKKHNAERLLLKDIRLIGESNKIIAEAEKQSRTIIEQVALLAKCLQKRFDKNPEWFVKHEHALSDLFDQFPSVFFQLQNQIRKYLNQKPQLAFLG